MHYIGQSLIAINDRAARLRWDAVVDDDMDGYNVYVATGTPVNFKKANGHLLLEPEFITPILRPDVIYFFRVTSVDTTGNESPPSEHIEFRLNDYVADPNLRIVTPPRTIRLAAARKTSGSVYPDFMTILKWNDGYLSGRANITIESSTIIIKQVPGSNFSTLFTWEGEHET